jgi:hypothetical protein
VGECLKASRPCDSPGGWPTGRIAERGQAPPTGLEALAILQSHGAGGRIPVMAITANAMPGDLARGLAAGLFRDVTERIDSVRLNEAVDDALVAALGRGSAWERRARAHGHGACGAGDACRAAPIGVVPGRRPASVAACSCALTPAGGCQAGRGATVEELAVMVRQWKSRLRVTSPCSIGV